MPASAPIPDEPPGTRARLPPPVPIPVANVRLNPVRFLWYSAVLHRFFQGWLLLVVAPLLVAACLRSWTVVWLVPGIVFFTLIAREVARSFRNNPLIPGLVIGLQPLECIGLINMARDPGKTAYAVKKIAPYRLPCYPREVGVVFPCVAYLQPGPAPGYWGKFAPEPLSVGTGNRRLLAARAVELDPADVVRLRQLHARGLIPPRPDELMWLDETLTRVAPPPFPGGNPA